MRTQALLSMKNICKAFAGVPALDNVDFYVGHGEIHGLAGQNGAGKSTLIKILTGVYQKDSGEIILNGETIEPSSPKDARKKGINSIYQELNLIPNLSVAENISLGHEIMKNGRIDWNATTKRAETILSELGIDVDVHSLVRDQSVAVQQMIAIARAVSFDAKLIVMDEPTSSLEDSEVRTLMQIAKKLKEKGYSIIFITHRLDEMFEICDKITILRDGKLEGSYDIGELDKFDLILKMIGKSQDEFSEIGLKRRDGYAKENNILEVGNLSWRNKLNNVSFKMREGEILGVAGLLGAGKTEIAKSIFGAVSDFTGKVSIKGETYKKAPKYAIEKNIGFVSEDRKTEGILPKMSVLENLSIVLLPKISKFGLINKHKEKQIVKSFVEALGIKIANLDQEVRTLSGGNQQKVMLARWLCMNPDLLILDEPTRGIDVGAKLDVQKLIWKMAEDGVSVLMINSELDELTRACERVLIMHDGDAIAVLSDGDVTEDNIMSSIAKAGMVI